MESDKPKRRIRLIRPSESVESPSVVAPKRRIRLIRPSEMSNEKRDAIVADYESKNATRRALAITQLKAATASMKPGVRKDVPVTKSVLKPELAESLPENVVTEHIMPFLKGKDFNLAKVFFKAKDNIQKRAVGVILILSKLSRMKETGGGYAFWEARADVVPTARETDIPSEVEDFARGLKTGYDFEVTTGAQETMLRNGFPEYTEFSMVRRKGTMGNKSGIVIRFSVSTEGLNLRTKAGKNERDAREANVAEIAKSYLARIGDKGEEFAKFLIAKSKNVTDDRIAEKTSARATVEFAKTREKASFIQPDEFYKIAYAFTGNEGRAREFADKLITKADGRPMKFWLPRGKNLHTEIKKD